VYDTAIIGGGLAGLALSIKLSKAGHSVILFEKEQYPFHKVCGEYISLESWDYLRSLGLPLEEMNLPMIGRLQVSGINGKMIEQKLPLGGFGISRYKIDNMLAEIAISCGVKLMEETKVNDVLVSGKEFQIHTSRGNYQARLASGSYGKRSNLDVRWNRKFSIAGANKLNNYIGVKYHVHADYPSDTIGLHLFPNGYCGIVKVEDEKWNLCYLTTAANLKASHGNISEMEADILCRNPNLKKIFTRAKKIQKEPVTISQISFDKKSQVENHILMVGDAAGMITPLCGNGMSMALHASKIAARSIQDFLSGKIKREELENEYSKKWQQLFRSRLRTGRRIQRLFNNAALTGLVIGTAKIFPSIIRTMVKHTHGRPF
jgi:menaquinone-9 beta-reductase